jgi:DNA-binding transcriptional ArsR family regulator
MDIQISSIGNALFPKTRQRVLAILYGTPEHSYYRNEIIRRAGVGRGAVSRELSGLSLAGIITETRQGNQIHYQANPNCPIFDDLRGIVIKSFGVVDVLQESLADILSLMFEAFVYGSIAKGTDRGDSDIDLMILSDELTYSEVMQHLEPAGRQLHRVINPTIYSIEEFENKRGTKNFLKNVMDQPKLRLKKRTPVERTVGSS